MPKSIDLIRQACLKLMRTSLKRSSVKVIYFVFWIMVTLLQLVVYGLVFLVVTSFFTASIISPIKLSQNTDRLFLISVGMNVIVLTMLIPKFLKRLHKKMGDSGQ